MNVCDSIYACLVLIRLQLIYSVSGENQQENNDDSFVCAVPEMCLLSVENTSRCAWSLGTLVLTIMCHLHPVFIPPMISYGG